MWRWLVLLVACSSPQQPKPPIATPSPTPTPTPVASPPTKSEPQWGEEILDVDVLGDYAVQIFATPKGLAILATPGSMSRAAWLVQTKRGWVNTLAIKGHGMAAAIDPKGEPWLVIEQDGKLVASHGATTETIPGTFDDSDRMALTIDRNGTPHACLAIGQTQKNNQPAERKLAYATRAATGWTVETLPAKALGCAIAVADDGTISIGADDGVVVKRGTWKVESLGGTTRVTRDASGKVIAVTEKPGTFTITRDDKQSPLVDKLEGDPVWWAIAADTRVHIAYDLRDKRGAAEMYYAVEGKPPEPFAEADAQYGVGLALVDGEPHIAYVPSWTQKDNNTVRYTHHVGTHGDRTFDTDGMIAACGAVIGDDLMAEPRLAEPLVQRGMRMCGQFQKTPPRLEYLAERCRSGSTDACFLAAAMVGGPTSRTAMQVLELAPCPKQKHCVTTYHEDAEFGQFAVHAKSGNDDNRAVTFLDLACKQGHQGACLQSKVATEPDAVPRYVELCSAALPLACARALTQVDLKNPPELAPVREILEKACATSQQPTACDSLAFMKELGLGGRASHHEALAHRQRACVLGSGTSCARIVGPKPPKDLEGEKFAELLADRCSKHTEEACLTLAGAYSRGWLLVRDFDKARQVLTNACDDGVEGACKRLGRRPPR